MMSREVHYEGWLTKSPPTKRIWRARWRRRWFTLKQGELPGQYLLEYYTDRNCRKLKGVIDLDQCEQVDAGLCMERKFQHVFNVKTPRRIYYLAADSDEDMRYWVNCICHVCGLQDLSKSGDLRQYYNIGPGAIEDAPLSMLHTNSILDTNDLSNDNTTNISKDNNNMKKVKLLPMEQSYDDRSSTLRRSSRTYQNEDFSYCGSEYTSRNTLTCDDGSIQNNTNPFNTLVPAVSNKENKESYYNLINIKSEGNNALKLSSNNGNVEQINSSQPNIGTGAVRKIPENLKLNEICLSADNSEPSPSLSTCSGPYIPISECFSGSPVLLNNDNPSTPLNSLDPKFYDTPRSHINIGLNLTDEQPYSPKRNNCSAILRPRSGRSSPTDSESVFTDDEWTHADSHHTTLDRRLRPSDSSVENEIIGWTYVQRFSKIPDDVRNQNKLGETFSENKTQERIPPRPPKRLSGLILDGIEIRSKTDIQSSDTENASPAIGPKDSSCNIEESYDIPRSHRSPYYNFSNNNNNENDNIAISPTLITNHDLLAASTPNLITSTINSMINTCKIVNRSHCYTNAAPSKIEGNVFRYDFMEQTEAPAVNRNLKPKQCSSSETKLETISLIPEVLTPLATLQNSQQLISNAPNVNRKLKPATPKFDTNSLRRKGAPVSLSITNDDNSDEEANSTFDSLPRLTKLNSLFSKSTQITPSRSDDKLQYLDLDHSSTPQRNPTRKLSSSSISNLSHNTNRPQPNQGAYSIDLGISAGSTSNDRGIVYKTVDFVKTEAFKRTRQDAELNRATNHRSKE